ncbi:MAG: phenylacetate--CoA ligase, partial [Clostridia bacterium]
MGIFFNEKIECLPRPELEALQLERLKITIKRVYERVQPYRDKMLAAGVHPEDIESLADLQKLPFTNKSDLRDNYPFGMFAEPQEALVRIHASSGTTGKPTVVAYTANDLKLWAEMTARVIIMAGVTAHDTVQVAFGYGLFTGAFGMHYGLERVGALVVPMSVGNTKKQIMLMLDFGVTGLVCTPSYALYLAETAKTMGIEPKSIGLKYGLFGSE